MQKGLAVAFIGNISGIAPEATAGFYSKTLGAAVVSRTFTRHFYSGEMAAGDVATFLEVDDVLVPAAGRAPLTGLPSGS